MSALNRKKNVTPRREKNPKAPPKSSNPPPSLSLPSSQQVIPFRLPPEFAQDPDRFEFWTIRMPASVPLKDLAGRQLSTESDKNRFTSGSSDGNKTNYTLQFGHHTENESLRMILPKSQLSKNHDDGDDEEEGDEDIMVPLPKAFSRHVNVFEYQEDRGERHLAPPRDQAPEVDSSSILRLAYTHVPQKTGLKRRWQPIGCNSSQGVAKTNTASVKKNSHQKPIKEENKNMVSTPERKKQRRDSRVKIKQEDDGNMYTDSSDHVVKQEPGQNWSANQIKTESKSPEEENMDGSSHHHLAQESEEAGSPKQMQTEAKSPKENKKESKEARREAKKAKKEAKKARKSK